MPSSNEFKLTCAHITAMSYLEGSFQITDGEEDAPRLRPS